MYSKAQLFGDHFEFYNTSNIVPSLDGYELKVVAYDDRDYKHRMFIRKDEFGNVEFVAGMCLDLLLALQQALKFSYIPIEGITWYRKDRNGTVTGMAGQVLHGEADLSIAQASMVMLTQAMNDITYLLPTSYGKLSVFFVQPRSSHDVLCEVFGYKIWICWIFSWTILAITVFSVKSILSKLKSPVAAAPSFPDSSTVTTESSENPNSIQELILWFFATVSGQGWSDKKEAAPTKAVFLISMLYAFMITIFFSASLTSNLATETILVKTFSDFAKMSSVHVSGDRRLPVVRDIVKDVYMQRKKVYRKNDTATRQNSEKYLATRYTNFTDALHTIKKSGFITLEDAASSVIENAGYSDVYFCETISSVRVNNQRFPSAMFVRKGSYLKEIFNRKISLFIERGINYRLNEHYFRKTIISCPLIEGSYRGGLQITDIAVAYGFGFGGLFVSILSLIIELCKRRFKTVEIQ